MRCIKAMKAGPLLVSRSVGCLLLLCALNACQSVTVPENKVGRGNETDLVLQTRRWWQEKGMAGARDALTVELGRRDAGQGFIEGRMWRTNADKSFAYPDSLAQVPVAERKRTGIFFLLGFDPRTGDSVAVIQQVVDYLNSQGWHAQMVPVPAHRTAGEDAAAVQASLVEHLPQVDQAILIGFSKGGLDWMHWFAGPAKELTAADRAKIRLMLTFAGAVRGSAVADWLTHADGPVAFCTRWYVRLFDRDGAETMKEIEWISVDPWAREPKPRLRELTPDLRVVSLVAIPEGRRGRTEVHRGFSLLSALVTMKWRWLGPLDGMTESASQVLPAESGVPQHLVRVLGSHALLDGRYVNGGVVSKAYAAQGADFWRGGEELLDDLLRALPRDWVIRTR